LPPGRDLPLTAYNARWDTLVAVRLADLELARDAYWGELCRAAEAWVRAREAGLPTGPIDERMRRAEREWRRYERRIRRERRRAG
jgi:hypothetical protein